VGQHAVVNDERGPAAAERVRAVYESSHARLWRAVLVFAGSREVADDAVAEAFAQALRRGEAVRDVEAWVWRSAFAIARGHLAARRAHDELDGDIDGPGPDLPEPAVDLLRALSRLSARDRELLVLCHVGGWTPTALARVTGTPAATVRIRLHRATRRARALLQEEDLR
jgi:RNA polymerase sigma-70 factor, ECF subfamily